MLSRCQGACFDMLICLFTYNIIAMCFEELVVYNALKTI